MFDPEKKPGVALLVFGAGMPVAALAVELITRVCAEAVFDPLPSIFHVLLVAFVVVANAWGWFVAREQRFAQARWALWAVGIAIGVAMLYTVLFLPLMPLSILGVILYGLGVLVWAPLSALIAGFRLRRHLLRLAQQHNIEVRVWPAVLAGLLALIALDLPTTMTRIGARLALDETAADTRARGMRMLRAFGSEDTLLRMCYVRRSATNDLLGVLFMRDRPVDPQSARDLYYRMTGRAFNSVPAPVNTRRDSWFAADWDQGQESVGGRVQHLSLSSSRLDGSVGADAALGYLEWTMVFKNAGQAPSEARTQIALPPGAVVSRLTLWINGEEREAAFAGRRQVREAYQAVVSQRRDPVLVTTAGPGRISMQLFPVPPQGEMKVRVGMTMPLKLNGANEGVLRLPYFQERNFELRDDLKHSVWIESKSPLRGAGVAPSGSGIFRTDLEDERLDERETVILASREDQSIAWSSDLRAPEYIVRQVIDADQSTRGPGSLVIVMDGSTSVRKAAPRIAQALAALPESAAVSLIFAHDEKKTAEHIRALGGATAAEQIESFDFSGGHDNTAALVRGLDIAGSQPGAVLLWIHGPQPVLLQTDEALLQRLQRGAPVSQWYELQVEPGRNLLTEKLDGVARIETLRDGELEQVVSTWGTEPSFTVRRERVEAKENAAAMAEGERTSDHLARLWANDEVARLIRAGFTSEAVELAQRYQLVTPVSGAVVLETQQQYAAAGLQPVPEGTVPTIPEPEEWALILIALGALAYAILRRRAPLAA